jgi:hypothetical protein
MPGLRVGAARSCKRGRSGNGNATGLPWAWLRGIVCHFHCPRRWTLNVLHSINSRMHVSSLGFPTADPLRLMSGQASRRAGKRC